MQQSLKPASRMVTALLIFLIAQIASSPAAATAQEPTVHDTWRGWVAVEETFLPEYWGGGDSHHVNRALYADVSRDNQYGSVKADIYYRFQVAHPDFHCQKSEHAGTAILPAFLPVGGANNSEALDHALPVPTEMYGWDGRQTDGYVQMPGIQRFCGDPEVHETEEGESPANTLWAGIAWPSTQWEVPPMTVSRSYAMTDNQVPRRYALTVCMSRSTTDSDGDGFPDDVDLDPSAAASEETDLGVPGGPPDQVIEPKFGGPAGVSGLPACPAAPTQCSGIAAQDVLPDRVLPPLLSSFPNDDAACAAVWIPELEDGFVAQGLALVGDGTALVSGYIHPLGDPKKDKSGEHCRIVHVDLTTGELLDSTSYDDDFEPSTCKHGGGIAIDSDGRVWIADTKKLLLLTGSDIFDDPVPLLLRFGWGEGLRGSFLVDGRSDHLWVGIFEKKKKDGPAAGKIYEFETDYLEDRFGLQSIKRRAATDVRNVPVETQGAAFKGDALFAASSTATKGRLKTDHGTFGFGPGVEEIEFSGECLWAVFEAGARIYKRKSFPVIARFDPGLIPNAFDPHPECAVG